MLITKKQFLNKYANQELKLAFIGMSNVGKTIKAQKLSAAKNFRYKTVDLNIAEKLGLTNEAEVSDWMGQPYNDKFSQTQAEYLQAEGELTQDEEILKNYNYILDTTGSVIYLSSDVKEWIKNNFLIVYGITPAKKLAEMTDKYFANPKPVVWGDKFNQLPGESGEAALRRCYPELLKYRQDEYQKLSDITSNIFSDKEISMDDFFNSILNSLPD